MNQKSCKCGKTKKNFFIDIGPFFINDCCIEAGFDHLGNLAKPSVMEDGGKPSEKVNKDEPKKRKYFKGGNIKKQV